MNTKQYEDMSLEERKEIFDSVMNATCDIETSRTFLAQMIKHLDKIIPRLNTYHLHYPDFSNFNTIDTKYISIVQQYVGYLYVSGIPANFEGKYIAVLDKDNYHVVHIIAAMCDDEWVIKYVKSILPQIQKDIDMTLEAKREEIESLENEQNLIKNLISNF